MKLPLLTCGLSLTAAAWTAVVGGCGGDTFSTAAGDGGSDVSSGDGPVVDSTPPLDSGPGGHDGGGGFCEGPGASALFCEDFDRYKNVDALLGSSNWTTFQQSSGGQFTFDTAHALSAPNALEVVGSDGAQILLVKEFPPLNKDLTQARLEFDLRVNSAGSVGYLAAAGFAAIAFGSSIESGYAAIAIGNGPSLVAAWAVAADAGVDGGSWNTAKPTGGFPTLGSWAGRYAIELDYSDSGGVRSGCVQIYDGATALLQPCLRLPPELSSPKVLSIALGDEAAGLGSTGNVNVEFDNVTFNAQ